MEFATLMEMLEYRTRDAGGKTAFTFEGQATTFQTLWQRVNQFAAYLLNQRLVRGERVLIALPNGADFFYAFYGIQRAGGIAVPLFPESSTERIAALAKACGARFVVLPPGTPKKEEFEKGGLVTLDSNGEAPAVQSFPRIQPDDIAFLQYTSGSTGNPKGVILTHANLLTNMRQMITGMRITEEDRFVSWLPVYHDMGLILMTMIPFSLAADLHLLLADLRSVRDWLKTIHEVHGTFTAAPDFAYRLCLRHLESLRGFDLSSLRVALNAAEPVRLSTIAGFESAFRLGPVMVAGYGLAEATVGVSMWPPGMPPRLDANGLVSVGPPFPGIELQIAKEDPLNAFGEIMIKSPANSKGYFNNPEETKVMFSKDGFLHSGDLGTLDEAGNLYIAGRKKNIIKHAGETIAPQEIEETVDVIPDVRFSAAVGVDRGRLEGEQAYVFAEVRQKANMDDWGYELVLEIMQAIHRRLGIRPARVYLVQPHTIPRTHNGKIQYVHLRDAYLDGTLREQGKILYPEY